LLDARLVAPLGGKYEVREFPGGLQSWVSTALADAGNPSTPPEGYQFPALNWLRGIDFELRAEQGSLSMHGEVIMPVEAKPAGFQLPNLFGALGGANDKKTKDTAPKTPPVKPAPAPSGPRQF
jgi:hypothetical protein